MIKVPEGQRAAAKLVSARSVWRPAGGSDEVAASGLPSEEHLRLRAGASAVGVDLSSAAEDRLMQLVALVRRWGTRSNLVAGGDHALLVERHIVDSLAVVPLLRAGLPEVARIVDLGSGAGFPGIPLAIVLARSHLTLVESRCRRASFLRAAARELGVAFEVAHEDATAFAARSAGRFDAVVSRAAFAPVELLRLSAALLRDDGVAVSFAGSVRRVSEERLATPALGAPEFHEGEIKSYCLPGRPEALSLVSWVRRCST